jgi:hypothetical protein
MPSWIAIRTTRMAQRETVKPSSSRCLLAGPLLRHATRSWRFNFPHKTMMRRITHGPRTIWCMPTRTTRERAQPKTLSPYTSQSHRLIADALPHRYVFGSNHSGDLCFNATHAPGTDLPSIFAPHLQQNGTSYRVDDSSPGSAEGGHAWPVTPCALFGKKVLMQMGPDVCASPPPPASLRAMGA